MEPYEAGQRLDRYLSRYMPGASKGFFYKMLRKKNIVLNGKKAEGGERVRAGDKIRLFLSEDTISGFQAPSGGTRLELKDLDRHLDVVYEDEDILVANKPAGLLSQKAKKDDVSLVEYIEAYIESGASESEGAVSRAARCVGICNRLDRNTSGLVASGKTVAGLRCMNSIFREQKLKKTYLCIVKGRVKKAARAEGYLIKDAKKNIVSVADEADGGKDEKPARIITEYAPLDYGRLYGREYTLLKVVIPTGKPHQIRAHLKSEGYPIVGDVKYGDAKTADVFRRAYGLRRQLLHAWRMEIGADSEIPQKYRGMVFTAPLPRQFADIMKGLGMKPI